MGEVAFQMEHKVLKMPSDGYCLAGGLICVPAYLVAVVLNNVTTTQKEAWWRSKSQNCLKHIPIFGVAF